MSRQITPTGPEHLQMPKLRAGMDHDFYAPRDTWSVPRLDFGPDVHLGIWLQIAVEWFPLDISGQPFLPIGAPARPWPDSETYTQRDYGNRIGIYRMMDALAARGMTASAFLNARVAQRYPILARYIREAGWDVVAAGLDAGAIHHEGLHEDTERAMIAEALSLLRAEGLEPAGWHSPSWSQSTRTPRLLREAGITAMADWANDEAPYAFQTGTGTIASLPAAFELSDREILFARQARLADFEANITAAARRLTREAADSGTPRLLCLNLSPWLMGQPFRIAGFERILDMLGGIDGARTVQVADILAASLDLRNG